MRVIWGMFAGVYVGAALWGAFAVWALSGEASFDLRLVGGALILAFSLLFGILGYLRQAPARDHHPIKRLGMGLTTAWALASVLVGVSFAGILVWTALQDDLGHAVRFGDLIESWSDVMGIVGTCGLVIGFIIGYRAR